MDFWRRTDSEEGEGGEIGRQGDVHDFSGCTQDHLHPLLGKRINNNSSVLCVVIAPVERRNKKKRPLKEKKILFQQDNAQVHTCTVSMAKFMVLKFELLQHPPDLAPSDFFYFQTWKNNSVDNSSRRTRRYHSNRYLFWGPSEILLFGRLKKVGETQNNLFFYLFLRTYWTALVSKKTFKRF